MKCSQIKCIVNRLVGHREARLGRRFLKRPDGVVCEQVGTCTDHGCQMAFQIPQRRGLADQVGWAVLHTLSFGKDSGGEDQNQLG